MKTAVSIPDRLFKAADRIAKRLGMSRSELYARAIERFVSEQSEAEITKTLNEVYGDDPGSVDPVLMSMQLTAMKREPW